MRLPTITNLQSVESDGKGLLTFRFKSSDGRSHYVPMKSSVLNSILPVAINVAKTFLSGDGHEVQAVTLTSARGAFLEDGVAAIALAFDGVPLMVALPPNALQGLKIEIDKLIDGEGLPGGSVRH